MSARENAKRIVVDRMAKRRNLTSRRPERSRRPSIRWVEPLEDRIALIATPLGPQFLINETLGVGENAPAKAVLFNQGSQAGAFVVEWNGFEKDGSGYGVYGRVMKADGQYADLDCNGLDDDTFLINSLTPGNQVGASVASDAAGNVLIAWQGKDRGNVGSDVYCRRASFIASAGGITGGVEADPEVLVNETLQGDQIQAAVAQDSAGNFVVTWRGENADQALGREVYARYGRFGDGLRRGGTATAEFVLNDTAAGDQVPPSADMVASGAGAGEFVVTWSGQVGGISEEEESTYVVLAKLFQVDGTAIDPAGDVTGEFQVSATVLHDQVVPVAAVNPYATVVVAWQSEGGQATGADMHARRLDLTGQFIDVAHLSVNQTLTGPQNAPVVAIAEYGRFVITWHIIHQDGSSRGVYARAFAADGSSSDEIQVNDLIQSGPQSLTGVAIGSDGLTVIVWLGPQVPEHGG
jgi:hypothetical protein